MDNSPDKESPDAPTQLRALADDKIAATSAYASDLRRAASEIDRLRAVLWSIGHAAGVETKEDLMKAARDALPQSS